MTTSKQMLSAGLGLLALLLLAWGCNETTEPDGCPGPIVPTAAPTPRISSGPLAVDSYTIIETFAGNGVQGNGADGLSPEATALYWPQDIAFGPLGHAFILDWNNHRVRVLIDGKLRTLIGTGYLGDAPEGCSRDIGLNHPTHVSFDPEGNLVVAAWHNSKVLRVDLATNWVQPLCGTGARSYGGDGGPAIEAVLDLPVCTLIDDDGRLLIMDQANQCVRRIDNGMIDTFAGTPKQAGFEGDGGPAALAKFNFPTGQAAPPSGRMAVDSQGKIYIADTGNNRIRVLEPTGGLPGAPSFAHEDYTVSTIAGNGERAFAGENVPALEASFALPGDVDVDTQGNVWIADTFNHCIRRVSPDGIVTTVVGTPGSSGYGGDGGSALGALLNRPYGIAFDAEENLYIADFGNNRIRVVWKDPTAH